MQKAIDNVFDIEYNIVAKCNWRGVEKMVNTPKIKGRIVELSLNQTEIAKSLGIAQPTLNQKINNIRPFKLDEVGALQKILKIPDLDFATYFFAQ